MITLLCTAFLSLTLASSVYGEVNITANSTASPSISETVLELDVQPRASAILGGNVTLPCRLQRQSGLSFGSMGMRIKWTKLSADESLEEDVLVSMGFHKKSYGSFNGRIHLLGADQDDASLVISDITAEDAGKFRCEVIDGMDDAIQDVVLEVEDSSVVLSAENVPGVVFPYSPHLGRYNLNFQEAERACESQASVVANFDQLYEAWRGGLDWCNAGWLNDGSVQYPINNPRGPCGGTSAGPGLRNYGLRDKSKSLYDVFCFASGQKGDFYWLVQPHKLTFDQAVQACQEDGAEIAKVGHMYYAWKVQGYDRCDSGWLADGSVRYPISNPRKNCSPTEAAVRFVGFPDKKHKLYGVYCFKAQE